VSLETRGTAWRGGAQAGGAGTSVVAAPGKSALSDGERLDFITGHLGIPTSRVVTLDHHACHAAAAYYGAPFSDRDALVLTNDNSGDGLCATAARGTAMGVTRLEASPSAPGSLGSFYSFVTLLLGMKFGEHEYKVMGLAPYAGARETAHATSVLREVFDLVEDDPCRFAWKRRGPRYRQLVEATLGLRFDAIAGGAQAIVEETLLRWARLMHRRYGGDRLALGGGVFMNVKANMLVAAEEWVRDLFVFRRAATSRTRSVPPISDTAALRDAGVRAVPQPLGARTSGRPPGFRHRGDAATAQHRGAAPRERAGADRGEDRGAARLRRVVARLRGAHGVRSPGARESLDSRPSIAPVRRRHDQPHDQESRLLDAVPPRRSCASAPTTISSIRAA
jgi:hypothetical protein